MNAKTSQITLWVEMFSPCGNIVEDVSPLSLQINHRCNGLSHKLLDGRAKLVCNAKEKMFDVISNEDDWANKEPKNET
jgi:hypothetical protein